MKNILLIFILSSAIVAKAQITFENIYGNLGSTKFAWDVIQKADSSYLLLGLDFNTIRGHLISVDKIGNITSDYTTGNIYSQSLYSFDTTRGGNILYSSSISNTFTFCSSTGSIFTYTNSPPFSNSFLSRKNENYLFFRNNPIDTIKIVVVDTLANILHETKVLPTGIISWSPNRVLWSQDNSYTLGLHVFNSAHARGISVIKCDTSGSILWQTNFNDTLSLQKITTTSDSGVIITGNCWDTTSNAATNIFYLKLNKSGSLQWYKRSTHKYFIWAYSALFETSDGGYIIGKSEDVLNQGDEIVMIKLDSSGNEMWSKSFGRTINDLLGSIKETLDGGFILSGCSYDTSLIGHYYLIKTDSLGNVGTANYISDIYSGNLLSTMYPNPFIDKLNIIANENTKTEIILYDMLSRELLHQTFTNSIVLDTQNLPKGIYIYKMQNNNGAIKNGKVVKD
ncbi:MAG: T9SS type A sorting domain-containing protein [Bacteroidetes bacterium]|nr:T9SS type A sorting domain-containing protein [Bacteroidota bacterium]